MTKLVKTILALTAGYAGGLLLAKKSGKDLRKELKKSENPAKTMFNAMKDADLEAFKDFKDWWENSEKIQSLVKTGKDYFAEVSNEAKEMGTEAIKKTSQELERVANDAQKAANKLKKEAIKKGHEVKKKATKFKNELEQKTKTIAKKIRK